jgi:hypothetical protein
MLLLWKFIHLIVVLPIVTVDTHAHVSDATVNKVNGDVSRRA